MSELSVDVLVVGGGFAGRCASRKIASNGLSVALVDPKSFFEFTPSILRALLVPQSVSHITAEHSQVGVNIRFLRGIVSNLTESTATVELAESATMNNRNINASNVPVSFRYCIWAGGSAYPEPIRASLTSCGSVAHRKRELAGWRERLRGAKSVLVLGGGLVGVELAAELSELTNRTSRDGWANVHSIWRRCWEMLRRSGPVEAQPRMNIWLAAPRGLLIPRLPQRASRKALKFLESRGVVVIKSRLMPDKKGRASVKRLGYVSNDGPDVRISPDIVFDCTGPRQGAAGNSIRALAQLCGNRNALAPGRACLVRVRDTLQLPGVDNVFVAGDAAVVDGELDPVGSGGLGCEKTAYAAMEAGRLAAENVIALSRAGAESATISPSLKRYPGNAFPTGKFPRLFAVSLGKWDGILCVGPVVIGGPIVSVCKAGVQVLSVRALQKGGMAGHTLVFVESCMYWAVHLASRLFRYGQRNGLNGGRPRTSLGVSRP